MQAVHSGPFGKREQLALLVLIVFIAINLRPFLTGIGPVTELIRDDTGLGYRGIAMLTLLPTLIMGVGAFLSPGIQAVVGTRRGILTALLLLLLGSLLRLVAPGGLTLVTTAVLCGLGVAFIQSALPGVIKAHFPARTALVTGLYSATIMGGGAIGAKLTPLVAESGGDWRQALAWLALPAAIALLIAWRTLAERRTDAPDRSIALRLLRRPRTWLLIACFGLVNAGYSSMVAWLAPYYMQRGWSPVQSADLISVMAICQAVAALGIAALASRSRDRRPLLWLTLSLQGTGFAGLLLLPDLSPMTWAAVCGAGLGGNFSISLVTALDHLPKPQQAGALTALMQGGGFLIAAMGPLAVALLHQWTGGFAAGWALHLSLVLLIFPLYLRLDPARYRRAIGPAVG